MQDARTPRLDASSQQFLAHRAEVGGALRLIDESPGMKCRIDPRPGLTPFSHFHRGADEIDPPLGHLQNRLPRGVRRISHPLAGESSQVAFHFLQTRGQRTFVVGRLRHPHSHDKRKGGIGRNLPVAAGGITAS